ncbi:MAG: hypothetical protein KKD77_21065, partial [Gammaproteobacteria bacterium]|nr:hypothetical protein [Gammaproteobacteria bacterium]
VCPRADSQKLLEKIIPFGDAVAVALMNDRTLGATCSTYGALSYTFGGINWAAAPGEPPDGIGFTFTISDIKHNDATSLESE